jgi:hypothetical protein
LFFNFLSDNFMSSILPEAEFKGFRQRNVSSW